MRCGELIKSLEMMKTHVQTTTPDATLAQAVDLMDLYQTPSLPVLDAEKRLVGIISERDILNAVWEHGVERAKNLRTSDVMSTQVISVFAHQDVTDLLQTLFNGKWKRMPVMDDEGRLIGMLNRVDVLQALFEGSISDEFPEPV
jgi:CBS-domain-containing membrane protein